MINWDELTDAEQIYLFWEYQANTDEDDPMTFEEFDELMRWA